MAIAREAEPVGSLREVKKAGMSVPFTPPLENAFIPQVEDALAGLRELVAY